MMPFKSLTSSAYDKILMMFVGLTTEVERAKGGVGWGGGLIANAGERTRRV